MNETSGFGRDERFQQLMEERLKEGAGPEILSEVAAAVRPIARRRPPQQVYPFQQRAEWDRDLLEEVTFDFAEHLLHGRLSQIFETARDTETLRLYLRLSAHQFLSNRQRGNESENLRHRAEEILETAAWARRCSAGGRPCWQLRELPDAEWAEMPDEEVRALARSLPLPESARRFRRNTVISSRVLSDDDLATLLRQALTAARRPLDRRGLTVLLKTRLGLQDRETLSTSWSVGKSPAVEDLFDVTEGQGIEEAEARITALDVAQLLTVRQLTILGHLFGLGMTREGVARELGVSRGTISNELERVGRVLLDASDGDEGLARRALEKLVDRVS